MIVVQRTFHDIPSDLIPSILSHLSNSEIYHGPLTVNKQWFHYSTIAWNPNITTDTNNTNNYYYNNNTTNALIYACRNGYFQLTKILLKDSRINVLEDDYRVLKDVVFNGHLDLLQLLVYHSNGKIQPNSKNNFALRGACMYGHWDMVRFLLNEPLVNPTSNHSNSPLELACSYGHLEIVKLLLSDTRVYQLMRFDVENDNQAKLIELASLNGRLNVVEYLLTNYPTLWKFKVYSSLKSAAENGHINVVKLLLSYMKRNNDDNHEIFNQNDVKEALFEARVEMVIYK